MRTFIVIVLVLAVIIGAVAIYLAATTPDESTPMQFPPSAAHRALLARVPTSADSFALIPTAVVLHRKLLENPVTRDPVEQWSAQQPIPSPWMIGAADVVIWKKDKVTSYAIRLDAFRAFVVRTWTMVSSHHVNGRWDGATFLINAPAETAIDAQTLDELLHLGAGLPQGEVFAVQRNRTRGVFPPIGRPAVSSVRVAKNEILITSRARSDEQRAPRQVSAKFPRGALLSVTFAQPPAMLRDLKQLVGTDVGALVADGGSIALYEINAGTLLPRPKGVISIPADDLRRAELANLTRVADLVGETRDTGQELLVSFDRTSVGHYLKDAFEPAPWPATRWAVRIDPQRMVPVLGELGDSRGLRWATPRFHRAARDLRRWIGALENAESIVAADSVSGGIEELRVRIASK